MQAVYADIPEERHEVRVTVPARNDVPVKVTWQAGTGDSTEIQANVEAVG